MPTSLAHAALSAAAVGVLLSALHRAGPRAGGLAAAVPISSIPALFWLSLERGGAYATTAVLGTLWGTGLTVLLGASFARLALAWPAALAGLVAWLAVGGLATLTRDLPTVPAAAAALTACASCSGLPPCRARRRAMQTGAPASAAERCCRWQPPVRCRCWCRSCPGTAVRSSAAGRRPPAGRHVRDRRELPARRCAPDAQGSGGLPRRHGGQGGVFRGLGRRLGAGCRHLGMADGPGRRGLRAARPAPLAADGASASARLRSAAPTDRQRRAALSALPSQPRR